MSADEVRAQAEFLPGENIKVTLTGDMVQVERCLTRDTAEAILAEFRKANGL